MGFRSLYRTGWVEPGMARRWLSIALVGGLGLACAAKPFVLEGDANYAGVAYAGDMESATAVARRHCAPFERVPRFREIQEDVAYFDCIRP
jgi:hypothetical protein